MPPVKKAAPPRRQFSTIEDAAKMLACHPNTVRNMISRGQIVGYRIGEKMLRVDLDEIQAMVEIVPAA